MSANTFNILHVDDDPNDVLLLNRALNKTTSGAAIHAVEDGDKAVDYLSGKDEFQNREKHPLPNLVLLDLKMPRKSGFEVLSWIRSQPSLRKTPVVVLSSSRHDEDVNRAYELGANSYLVKPVGFDSLQEVMKSINNYWGQLNQLPTLA